MHMRVNCRSWSLPAAAAGMFVLILDSQIACVGALKGVKLCIETLIPSLFPFFLISRLLTQQLSSTRFPIIEKICGVPRGCGSIVLIGLLGGYPTGAQNLYSAYESGTLRKVDAQRMLAFCSNAGPAFIFGMLSGKFSSLLIPWILWGIQITSAILVGIFYPGRNVSRVCKSQSKPNSLASNMQASIQAMLTVCGWAILFRSALEILQLRLFSGFSAGLNTVLAGLLELSVGCHSLSKISDEGIRFLLCCVFLHFGGICVLMQTASVVGTLGIKDYICGKLLQTAIGLVIAVCFLPLIEPNHHSLVSPFLAVGLMIAVFYVIIRNYKKTVAFPKNMLYNNTKNADWRESHDL